MYFFSGINLTRILTKERKVKKLTIIVSAAVLVALIGLLVSPFFGGIYSTASAAPSSHYPVGACVVVLYNDIEIDRGIIASAVYPNVTLTSGHSYSRWSYGIGHCPAPRATPSSRILVDPKSRVRVSDAMTATAPRAVPTQWFDRAQPRP